MDSPDILCTIRPPMSRRRDLVFLYGESVPRCTHVIDKHYAGYHTLQYMSAGAVELRIGERPFVLEGRAFWSAYPGPRFRFHAAAGQSSWSHRYIAFQGPLVKNWEREGLFPVPPRPSPGDADFAARFDELLECSRRSDARGVRRAVHLLEGILMELADAPPPSTDGDDDSAAWLQRMTRMLDASVASPIGPRPDLPDYAALAASVGVSERTLRRRFRDATGTSPHAYVLRRKTEEARRLLGETDFPIKAIAKRLGYADVYFFSRQFRQLAGVPPAQYRRSRQQ
jgi:AraC-like DNA-binding protein